MGVRFFINKKEGYKYNKREGENKLCDVGL